MAKMREREFMNEEGKSYKGVQFEIEIDAILTNTLYVQISKLKHYIDTTCYGGFVKSSFSSGFFQLVNKVDIRVYLSVYCPNPIQSTGVACRHMWQTAANLGSSSANGV